uniref:Uncharacterized protein n=1 Tax=Bartonella schoenbuchensis TaxID=165694 RepID=A0A024LSW8_9HYPH|nr:hypothetical protein BN1046_01485 [Bartonella schoenbuchensis]
MRKKVFYYVPSVGFFYVLIIAQVMHRMVGSKHTAHQLLLLALLQIMDKSLVVHNKHKRVMMSLMQRVLMQETQ